MKAVLWLISYALAMLFEIFIFPIFFGINIPSLTTAVFIAGIAFQEFVPGFWFAGLSGALRDALWPQEAAWHTIFSLGLFFSVRLFLAVTQWEEPLRRISAAAAGFLAIFPVWFLSSAAVRFFFGAEGSYIAWGDLASSLVIREIIFAAAWFSVFSWLTVKLWERKMSRRLGHL